MCSVDVDIAVQNGSGAPRSASGLANISLANKNKMAHSHSSSVGRTCKALLFEPETTLADAAQRNPQHVCQRMAIVMSVANSRGLFSVFLCAYHFDLSWPMTGGCDGALWVWLLANAVAQLVVQLPVRTRFLGKLGAATTDEDICGVFADFTKRTSWRACRLLSLLSYCGLVMAMLAILAIRPGLSSTLINVCRLEASTAAVHNAAVIHFWASREAQSVEVANVEGATARQIDALPTMCCSAVRSEDASCAICLGEYSEGAVLRRLPCGHHFHRCCADEWLGRNMQCPLCRCPISQASAVR